MKKIIAILISMLLLMTTSVFADGSIPEVLTEYPENFTAAYSISMSIDDNSDIRNLIEEIAIEYNYIDNIVMKDFVNFLTALFEYEGTIDMQADVSPDYKKIKLSLINSNALSSVVSSNLNYTINAKAGLWADIDLTDERAPKIDVIFLHPTSDKYYYLNAGQYISKDYLDDVFEFYDVYEFQELAETISPLLYSNSKIEKTRTGYKLFIDNDGFNAFVGAIATLNPNGDMTFDEETLSALKDMQFLGKDGITAIYTVKNGKISCAETKADISINLSDISMAIGEEWPYKASGIINIKLSEKADLTKIGSTVVKYPTLNDGNSISLNKMIEEEMNYYDPEYEYPVEYPYSYVSAYCDALPTVDGNYYVPLRAILEDGYGDSVSISYQDGVITASSEYFPEFKTLRMQIGSDRVYLDESERTLGTVMLVDGVTYVNVRLFTEVFGWELCDMTHNMIENSFDVGFWTFD